jgi:hypothetical protein
MSRMVLIVKEIAVSKIQLLLKKLSNYALAVWESANSGGLIISVESNGISSISYFNSLTAPIAAIGVGILLGIILGAVVVGCMVLYQSIRYNLFFKKKIMPNGSWDDFQRYEQDPKQFIIKTRGGDISSDDIQTAIDVIDEGLGIEKIGQFIKRQCFEKPGFYLMNARWSSKVLKQLKRLGIIKEIVLKNSPSTIKLISVDAFLYSASTISVTLLRIPYINNNINVTLTFVEFSKLKLFFNIFVLGGASLTSMLVVFNLMLTTSVWFLPIISSTPGYALIPSVTSSAQTLMLLASTYYYGHFLFWPNCNNFAKRIEGVTVDSDGQVLFPEPISDGSIIIDVPPSRTGAKTHDDFVDKVPASQIMQGSIFNNDGPIDKPSTLGDLESSPNLRGTGTRRPNQQVQTFTNIAEQTRLENSDFIDVTPEPEMCPMQSSAPVYEKIRTEVNQLADGDIL